MHLSLLLEKQPLVLVVGNLSAHEEGLIEVRFARLRTVLGCLYANFLVIGLPLHGEEAGEAHSSGCREHFQLDGNRIDDFVRMT